jgi:hypothetical protein
MSLLMVSLERNLRPFGEARGSNFDIISEGKLVDNEDLKKELRKEPEKEKPSLIVVNPSYSLFKMEVKVNINPYQGEIDILKLNHWLQQL